MADDELTATYTPRVRDFINRLARTLGAANGFIADQLQANGMEGLVPSHGDILMVLFAQETVTMQGLAEKINRDPSTVTALVKKLVKEGYVETRKSEADHRVTEVSLSKQGKSMQKEFEHISAQLVEIQMQGVSESDLAITCKTLDKVRTNFIGALEKGQDEE